MDWQSTFKANLSTANAPRIIDGTIFTNLAKQAGLLFPHDASDYLLLDAARDMEEQGLIQPVGDLWLNQACVPPASAPEIAQYFNEDAIVSLQTVLGDSGVFNNYTYSVTSVIPLSRLAVASLDGRVFTKSGINFSFYMIPKIYFEQAQEHDLVDTNFSYSRATPEAALVQWAYLVKSPLSALKYQPADIDVEALDSERLLRLADAFAVSDEIEQWLKKSEIYHSAHDSAEFGL